MQIGQWHWIGLIFKYLDRTVRSASVVVGAFSKSDPTKFPAFMADAIRYIQQGWVVPAILIGAPIVIWVRHATDRSKLETVHGLLDQIREHTFKNNKFELEQHARVTLFKHYWFCWRRWPFFGGWLIPVERSGHATRKTEAIFRAHDDGEKCEGIAGRAWSRRKNVYVGTLPQLRKKNPAATDAEFQDYANRSFCSVARLRRRPPQARSMYGIPVEVDNKRWGVIVIDSITEGFGHQSAKGIFNKLAPAMTSYLRGL